MKQESPRAESIDEHRASRRSRRSPTSEPPHGRRAAPSTMSRAVRASTSGAGLGAIASMAIRSWIDDSTSPRQKATDRGKRGSSMRKRAIDSGDSAAASTWR